MWDEIYDRIVALAGEHRSTLVFVNTRRLAERVAHHLAERMASHRRQGKHQKRRSPRITAACRANFGWPRSAS